MNIFRINNNYRYHTLEVLLTFIMIGIATQACNRNMRNNQNTGLTKLLSEYSETDTTNTKYQSAKFLFDNIAWHGEVCEDTVLADSDILDYNFFRRHIEHCVFIWNNSLFAKTLNFNQFKEYILPYCAAYGYGNHVDAKSRYEWVKRYVGLPDSPSNLKSWIFHYNQTLDSLRHSGGKRNALVREGLTDLFYNDFNGCQDKAIQTCLNLRAVGIPCVVERNLGYKTLRGFHYHCAVYDAYSNNWIRFDAEGTGQPIGEGDWTSNELLNVYRFTYASQNNEILKFKFKPKGFETPCCIDVTNHTVSLKVPLLTNSTLSNEYWIETFNRLSPDGLQPFSYGTSRGDAIIFKHVVPGVWYVITQYDSNGSKKIISDPFWVIESEGHKIFCKTAQWTKNTEHVETIVCERKYPIKEKLRKRAETLIGTIIEGANKADFSDAKQLWQLQFLPPPIMKRYSIGNQCSFRFYRIVVPKKCEISELQWIAGNDTIIPNQPNNPIYDNKMNTAPSDSTTITLINARPIKITAINFAPINADNGIKIGHNYELYYFNRGWKLLCRKTATQNNRIVFENIPTGALLWLKDITSGIEEMPFIYTGRKQQFIY